jgi:hypothetical protein
MRTDSVPLVPNIATSGVSIRAKWRYNPLVSSVVQHLSKGPLLRQESGSGEPSKEAL